MKKNKDSYCPVVLEPELESETSLLTPAQRRSLARKFRRWARQLEVSAFIMLRNQLQQEADAATAATALPSLKAVPPEILSQN